MHAMKDALMKYETIDAGQIDDLMNRSETIRAPQGWIDDAKDKADQSESKEEVKSDSSTPSKDQDLEEGDDKNKES